MIVGTSEEPMLSPKLTAVEKRDPTRGVAMGQYIPKWVWGQVLPRYLYFAGVLQRGMFARSREIVVGSEREPGLLWSSSNSPGMGSLWCYASIKLNLKPPGVFLLGLGVSPDLFTLQKHTCGKSIKRLIASTVRGSKARCKKP